MSGVDLPASSNDGAWTEEEEEKARLTQQVLELQNTLSDLSSRVDNVKEENFKLKSENQVLGQYIENLMSASSVFQSTTSPKSKKSQKKREKWMELVLPSFGDEGWGGGCVAKSVVLLFLELCVLLKLEWK